MAQPPSPRPSARPRILVVDDEPLIRGTLGELFEQEGWQVTAVGTVAEARRLAQNTTFDIMLCDLQLPDGDGVALLASLLKIQPELGVILITAFGTVETAVAAFQSGAHDYLLKPLHFDEVLAKVQNLLRLRQLLRDNQWLKRELHRQMGDEKIIGKSPALRAALATVAKVAPTSSNVLIVGESGTGKELIARALHDQSGAKEQKFIAVNCAAIPSDLLENQLFGHRKGAYTGADRDVEGLFVTVGGGTLFLDEIGEMSLATQAKLLRAIEQKEILPVGATEPIQVAARIVAATNKDLTREMAEKRFRDDLYYRLNVVTIELPPLRERREDLPDLIDHLVAKQARLLGKRVLGVSPEALQLLLTAPWPGNIRELENALQRALILSDGPFLTRADLPPGLAPSPDLPPTDNLREAMAYFEKQHLLRLLRTSPDKRDAARRAGLALSSLYRKIEELNIPLAEGKTPGDD